MRFCKSNRSSNKSLSGHALHVALQGSGRKAEPGSCWHSTRLTVGADKYLTDKQSFHFICRLLAALPKGADLIDLVRLARSRVARNAGGQRGPAKGSYQDYYAAMFPAHRLSSAQSMWAQRPARQPRWERGQRFGVRGMVRAPRSCPAGP